MSGLLFLGDTCDVLRRSKTTQAYGSKPAYSPHLTAVPCRFVSKSQQGFNSITAEFVTVTTYKVIVQADQDIQEGDQVTNVALQGEAALTDIYQVDGGSISRRGRANATKVLALKKVS